MRRTHEIVRLSMICVVLCAVIAMSIIVGGPVGYMCASMTSLCLTVDIFMLYKTIKESKR